MDSIPGPEWVTWPFAVGLFISGLTFAVHRLRRLALALRDLFKEPPPEPLAERGEDP